MYKPGLSLLYDIVHFYNCDHDDEIIFVVDFLCLTPLSAIFQLYHGNQF